MEKNMKRFAIPALLAAVIVAALATAVWSGSGRADACSRLITRVVHGYWATMWISCEGVSPWDLFDQDTSGDAYFGSWLYDVHGNLIPGDAVRPGVVEEYTSSGPRSLGVYVGDRVRTPWVDANDQLRWTVSEVAVSYGHNFSTGAQYITTPQRPAVSTDDQVVYTLGSKHRAVLGADGNYYREELLRGGWQRSGSYGDDLDALRKASWNAYYRSQQVETIDPATGTFPSAAAPQIGVSQTLVSNINQGNLGNGGTAASDHAQSFTTGIHRSGYVVNAIDLRFSIGIPTGDSDPTTRVEIWSSQDGVPHQRLGTLLTPSRLVAGVTSFTSSGIRLEARTTYFIVIDWQPDGETAPSLLNTGVSDEDQAADGNWNIGNTSLYRNSTDPGASWQSFSGVRKVAIHGYPR